MFALSVRHFLAMLYLAAMSASAAPSLSLSVAGADSVVDVSNLEVATTVTNTGDETLKILNDPSSVLVSDYATNSFSISSLADNASPKFTGVKLKYVPEYVVAKAADSSFTVLAPGESVTVSHNLGAAYNFTTSGEATYKIAPSDVFSVVDASGSLVSLKASTVDTHTAALKGTLSVARRSNLNKRISYNGCSSSRQSTLVTAAAAAQSYASAANSYLTANTASTARYVKWFGTYTSSRHSTVASHYANMLQHPYADYEYDCTCTDSDVYAYVYPDEFGTIYLCAVFWEVSNTGTDSRGGTLIHESSHFDIIGETQDYVYGQSAAASLASSNPSEAIENADNHEYFAENNPALS
ncbi:peptidyl-Lys metalloendopeptidase [Hymenopellis radicata]|nr:peptidyl-Lys metalloendopeptidase [Hymenopellis radicata]